jgi:hypothetical protein
MAGSLGLASAVGAKATVQGRSILESNEYNRWRCRGGIGIDLVDRIRSTRAPCLPLVPLDCNRC